jgi:hypothetical protein
MFASSVTMPTGVPKKVRSSMATPVTPPLTTLLGIRNRSTSSAPSSAPAVIKA